MQLVKDWPRVVARSLSFWMGVLGLIGLIVPEVLFAATGIDSNPVFLWWLSFLLLLASLAGRLVRQDLPGWLEWVRLCGIGVVVALLAFVLASSAFALSENPFKSAPQPAPKPVVSELAGEAATLAIAVPLIAKWEGKRNKAYQDIVGVWTICYGHTRTARPGMVKSDRECIALLREEVAEYRSGLHGYFSEETRKNRLTPERDTAYTSLAFNVGIRGAGRSTATRRLNAGDIAGGCQALTWWNKAGGRVIRGLVNRRKEEHALCMVGV